MNNTQKLLTDAQKRVPRQSKDRLALEIKADQALVRRFFRGAGYPNAQHCMEIAKLLEIPVEDVIKQVAEDKKASRTKATTLMGWAAISAVSAVLYLGGTSTTYAASLLAKALHLH